MMNLSNNLARAHFFVPDRPAVSAARSEISYRPLNDRAGRIGILLIKTSVGPGDRIVLCAPDSNDAKDLVARSTLSRECVIVEETPRSPTGKIL